MEKPFSILNHLPFLHRVLPIFMLVMGTVMVVQLDPLFVISEDNLMG